MPGSQSIPMDVNRFDGGITFMLPVDTNIVEGDVVKFEFAYTVRRGSPWSNHSEADFDISAGDLHVEVNGGKIVETGVNNVEVLISDKGEFTLEIAGFDESLERVSRTTIPNTGGDEQ